MEGEVAKRRGITKEMLVPLNNNLRIVEPCSASPKKINVTRKG